MDEILHQLGGLFLGSVPTVILFLLVLMLYKTLVQVPLLKVLAERRARTLGTIEDAAAAVQSADAKAQEYEAKLRAARLEIGRQREQRLQHWNRERDNLLADVRRASGETVKSAKAGIEHDVSDVRSAIDANADALAAAVLKAVLPQVEQGQAAAQEGAR